MSASVAHVLSSCVSAAGLERGDTFLARWPLAPALFDFDFTRGRSALAESRAGLCARRAGVAMGTDILRLVARPRSSLHLRGRGGRIPSARASRQPVPFTAPKPTSPAPED